MLLKGPGVVQDLQSTGATFSSIMLTWNELSCVDRNGLLTGYRIEYGTTTFDNTEMVTGVSNTSFTATGLNPSTTYMFRVAAVNGNGTSEPYTIANFSTSVPQGNCF